jgi:hypothetical protein
MQVTMVRFVCRPKRLEIIGQKNAPAIPDAVAVIDKRAIGTVPILNSVLAKIIAVPEIVAIASDRINQAIRKITTCFSFAATLIVFQSDSQANETYAKNDRHLPRFEIAFLRGGPGRVRSHKEEGIVNTNHQSPTKNKTIRRGRVDDTDVFDMRKRSKILRTWTKTAAA